MSKEIDQLITALKEAAKRTEGWSNESGVFQEWILTCDGLRLYTKNRKTGAAHGSILVWSRLAAVKEPGSLFRQAEEKAIAALRENTQSSD